MLYIAETRDRIKDFWIFSLTLSQLSYFGDIYDVFSALPDFYLILLSVIELTINDHHWTCIFAVFEKSQPGIFETISLL